MPVIVRYFFGCGLKINHFLYLLPTMNGVSAFPVKAGAVWVISHELFMYRYLCFPMCSPHCFEEQSVNKT